MNTATEISNKSIHAKPAMNQGLDEINKDKNHTDNKDTNQEENSIERMVGILQSKFHFNKKFK